ncbi:sulfite exporter TauE/SafE family protein [Rubripirellula sp.]|nr:sulfite exporter TauE/SafE family protein [Rubripirellula sp.]MDA7915297.1 sulfite exporter TauE/SafE family protein [bacterium]MDB4557637.1 sulfite exporter TauE/SafE family protein [bacterium]MDB4644564.1 sulfite exporter TauE/SafE family protein [Rubripirellula sp.]MDB4770466.1 sulfite exporter TauE/SafE family protein [bacterium]
MDVELIISLVPFAVILCAGIFIQAAAGFAAGLVIVPALLWCGYSIPAAQCSLLVATIPQNIWGVWSLRDSIEPREVIWPGIGRVLFLPTGIGVLMLLDFVDEGTVRQLVGLIVLLVTLAIIFIQPEPRMHLHPIWAVIAFPLSGFFQGLVGMGGPPMVFWVQAHDWSTEKTRSFLFMMYLVSIFPALAFLYLAFGNQVIEPGVLALAMIPMLWVVTYFGLKFGSMLGRDRLRRITLGLLLIMGLAGLVGPMLN